MFSKARCDNLIGLLVSFENKTKTIQPCCEMPIDMIDSNDSTSVSVQPMRIRHGNGSSRTQRGRSRTPVRENINDAKILKNYEQVDYIDPNKDNKLTQFGLPSQTYSIMNMPSSDIENEVTNKMILAESESVEVIFDSGVINEPSNFENILPETSNSDTEFVNSCVSTAKHYPITSEIYDKRRAKKCHDFITEKLDAITLCTHRDDEFSSTKPQKLKESLVPSECGILTRSSKINCGNQGKHREKTGTQMVVVFRTPVHEVIPRNDMEKSSFVIGDFVAITNGVHKNKYGRVSKVFDDVVQVTVQLSQGFTNTILLSPLILQLQEVVAC